MPEPFMSPVAMADVRSHLELEGRGDHAHLVDVVRRAVILIQDRIGAPLVGVPPEDLSDEVRDEILDCVKAMHRDPAQSVSALVDAAAKRLKGKPATDRDIQRTIAELREESSVSMNDLVEAIAKRLKGKPVKKPDELVGAVAEKLEGKSAKPNSDDRKRSRARRTSEKTDEAPAPASDEGSGS